MKSYLSVRTYAIPLEHVEAWTAIGWKLKWRKERNDARGIGAIVETDEPIPLASHVASAEI